MSLINRLVSFLLLLCFLSDARACDLVKAAVDFQVIGDGFHRTLRLAANFSSSVRFINCRVSYLFQIPGGAFVDVDDLRQKMASTGAVNSRHCFSASPFDVEHPAGSVEIPQLQPIMFHSMQVQRKVFTFNDALQYPVHLRYHKATRKDDDSNVVEFSSPRIFLRCENNDTFMTNPNCRRHVEKIPCDCVAKGARCSAISLGAPNPEHVKVVVSVGNKNHMEFVSVTTIVAVFMSVTYLLYCLIRDRNKR